MEDLSFDPIESGNLPEMVNSTVKRQLKNIMKSYTGWFDPLCELIQNAIDAVEKRNQKAKDYTPTIWVKIDLKENMISVTDNGVGFTKEQFKTFLAPNVSFKTNKDRGNKGVGATYLAYGFNYLQIGTKSDDFSFLGNIKNGREWVDDETGTIIRPKVQPDAKVLHDAFDQIDIGSTFSLKLIGDNIRPKNLNWMGASNVDQWEAILRIKTALGGIYFTRPAILSKCKLTVIDDKGTKTEKEVTDCNYIYPHSVISSCRDLKDLKKVQQGLIDAGKDPSKLPDKYSKLNGLYSNWDYQDIISEKGELKSEFTETERTLAGKYKLNIYGFFCYSTDIWDKYNDDTLKLRKKGRILHGGIQLATNYMPQGDLIIIPLTSDIGYQNTTHLVIHMTDADPDLGRKGFQPELQALAQRIGVVIVNKFKLWKRLLKKDTGAPPNIAEARNLHDWIVEQEEHEKKHPLLIKRKDVFLPTTEPSITSTPSCEQDVISLFNQLLAGGVIRGIRLMATSQNQQYDGVFRFCLKQPFENHIYNKINNPLGID
jgi:Histidine kinase-, DNA gyrase B-, and HSP90-like ATPase